MTILMTCTKGSVALPIHPWKEIYLYLFSSMLVSEAKTVLQYKTFDIHKRSKDGCGIN